MSCVLFLVFGSSPNPKNRNAVVVATNADKLGKWRWWFVYRAEGLKLSKNIQVVAELNPNNFLIFHVKADAGIP